MFAHTAFSPLLAVRMAAFDHLVCIATVKVSIISFFCLSTKMRRITNFGLERRASHASRSSLFQDSWITPVTISDPKLVYSSYFSSLPSFLDESFLVQQNHGCHWTSYKPASFRKHDEFALEYTSWFSYCLKIPPLRSWHAVFVTEAWCAQAVRWALMYAFIRAGQMLSATEILQTLDDR